MVIVTGDERERWEKFRIRNGFLVEMRRGVIAIAETSIIRG